MKDMMTYKGYVGSVHFSDKDEVFYGKVEFIKALISYEATNVKSLKKSFRDSIDDYLELCAQENQEPEKPLKGSFNVRTGSDLHRRLVEYARRKHLNLNQVVVNALQNYLTV